jgi:hypothetical protein
MKNDSDLSEELVKNGTRIIEEIKIKKKILRIEMYELS